MTAFDDKVKIFFARSLQLDVFTMRLEFECIGDEAIFRHSESRNLSSAVAPMYENVGKRQVRSPKVYIGDSGILHALLGLTAREEVVSHPKVGASWEGLVGQQIIHLPAARPAQCFHWSTHSGAELDLLVVARNRRCGFEVKRSEAPRLTGSIRSDALLPR